MTPESSEESLDRLKMVHYLYMIGHLWLDLTLANFPSIRDWFWRARYFDTSDRGSVNPRDLLSFAYCAAAQLGLPLTFSSVRNLLLNRDFFFNHLPFPPDDPRWKYGRDYGVGFVLWFWWQSKDTDPFRQQLSEIIAPIPDDIDRALFLFWPAIPDDVLDIYQRYRRDFTESSQK
ncbi:hypothetical protein SE15_03050 [Thermanaerothrix daxensis]|uniref:Uncharacterized protein n=1 Tax=Thermanaerothrix daxensis TaxID=869279 RepID=A0A0P6XV77_9CHLR|nr:hypothetical protein SE15_03050 [Thermanaerothrix daxensis]